MEVYKLYLYRIKIHSTHNIGYNFLLMFYLFILIYCLS